MPLRSLKTPSTVRDLVRKMHPLLKRKVRAALTDILADPNCGKPLQGELKGLWSLRVGRHRIIYRINREQHLVEVGVIAHRRDVYEMGADAIRLLERRGRYHAQPLRRP